MNQNILSMNNNAHKVIWGVNFICALWLYSRIATSSTVNCLYINICYLYVQLLSVFICDKVILY